MKRFIGTLLLIVLFVLVTGTILLFFLSEKEFTSANQLQKTSPFDKAAEKYSSAIRLNPLNSENYRELAAFYFRQGYGNRGRKDLLKKTEDLYKNALGVNSWNSYCWYNLGKVQAEVGRLGDIEDKEQKRLYISKSTESSHKKSDEGSRLEETRKILRIKDVMDSYRQAVINEPNGFDIARAVGSSALKIWGYLDESEREFVTKRLSFVLSLKPREFYKIKPLVWTYSRDFRLLKEITPKTIRYQSELLNFVLRQKEITSYAKEQSEFVRKLESQVGFNELPESKKRKSEYIKKLIKENENNSLHPAEFIKGDSWQGVSDSGEDNYEKGNMYWQGTIHSLISIPAGKIFVKIQAKGEQANGVFPYMLVELDGQVIGEEFVDSEDWKDYFFEVDERGGTKVLSITFLNDGGNEEKKEDRNLYVGKAWVEKISDSE